MAGQTGLELSEAIKKAIRDCEVTSSEYDRILSVANADGHVDDQEQKQLAQLQALLANGTVKRIPG